jgi:hypothetical protein
VIVYFGFVEKNLLILNKLRGCFYNSIQRGRIVLINEVVKKIWGIQQIDIEENEYSQYY